MTVIKLNGLNLGAEVRAAEAAAHDAVTAAAFAASDAADGVRDELAVDRAAAEAARAGAEQAEQNAVDISNIALDDDIVELLVKPGAAGPKTKAALAAEFAQRTRYNVDLYGLVADGVTDNAAAFEDLMALAIEESPAGKVIEFGEGTYKFDANVSPEPTTAASWWLRGDNLHIVGQGPQTVLDFRGGQNYVALVGNISKNMPDFASLVAQEYETPILPATRGVGAVTLATAAEAVNFSIGDSVLIRTGNVAGSNDFLGAPDAERNEVVGVNVGSGVITLKRALAKDYAQEYFIAGQDATSGTTGTDTGTYNGDPAPLAIRRIVPMKNLRISDVTILHDGPNAVFGGGKWVDGIEFDHVIAVCPSSFQSMSGHARLFAHDCDIHITGNGSVITAPYWFSTAWASGDAEIVRNRLSAEAGVLGRLHIHEGSYRVKARDNILINAPGYIDSNTGVISIRARGYDIDVEDNVLVNAGTASGGSFVRLDPSVTGRVGLRRLHLSGTAHTDLARSGAPDVTVEGWSSGAATLTNRYSRDNLGPVRAATDESRTSTTTLVQDSELTLTGFEPGVTYMVEALIKYDAGATGDFKFQFSMPSGSTFDFQSDGPGPGNSSTTGYVNSINAYARSNNDLIIAGGSAAGQVLRHYVRGLLTLGSIPGSVSLLTAQNTADGTPTVRKAGSWMYARRL